MDKIERNLKGNLFIDDVDESVVVEDETFVEPNNITNNNSSINSSQDFKKKFDIRREVLKATNAKRGPSCGLIVVDNFYSNAQATRDFMLTQDFKVKGNYPGQRTISFANEHLKEAIQKYVEPFAGKITEFPMPKADNSDAADIYNGAFQYTTSRDRSWVHVDAWNKWAGVLFLTPDAPLSAGTAFYRFHDGTTSEADNKLLNNKAETDNASQDLTKWELVDRAGNVFNRLILFNSHRYHMSMDYFGDTKENGRLFQVFFFSTER
jgi:hypothetical protein